VIAPIKYDIIIMAPMYYYISKSLSFKTYSCLFILLMSKIGQKYKINKVMA